MTTAASKIIEEFDALPYSEKEKAKQVIDKLMVEEARKEIKKNCDEGLKMSKEGKLKAYGNMDDLMNALNEN